MDALKEYRTLRSEGRLREALELARSSARQLPAHSLTALGRMLEKDLPKLDGPPEALSVLLLGQCTTTYLAAPLHARAWANGMRLSVHHGEYDQVLQELMAQSARPDVVILLPWHQRLLAPGTRDTTARVAEDLAFHQQSWAQVARLKSKLVQISHDWVGPGALGYALTGIRGDVALIKAANETLRAQLPAGAYWVDLEILSGHIGRERFYDPRNEAWLKQPFSVEGLDCLAQQVAEAMRALTFGRRKVLALDLDNTLWGGVVGESGPHNIIMGGAGEGEAFSAFQKHVRNLKDSGILLAVASKNNDADAREPFEVNDQMQLRLDDFAAFHACWTPKAESLQKMALALNLGLDSFVFVDDNPVEREQMRALLPEVMVVEMPEDPSQYIRALEQSLAFETSSLTAEDAERTALYQMESARQQMAASVASPGDYLRSLAMQAEVCPITEANLQRVVDLVTKTNQFNLTTRRHSTEAVRSLAEDPASVCFALKLADKFGDYGLIAVVLTRPLSPTALEIDTWLMSCRAMGREVEHFTLNALASRARLLGYNTLQGLCIPTAKNTPVQSLLADLGFRQAPESTEAHTLALDAFSNLPTTVS